MFFSSSLDISTNSSSTRVFNTSITWNKEQGHLSSVADIFGYELAQLISWVKVAYTGELSGFGPNGQ